MYQTLRLKLIVYTESTCVLLNFKSNVLGIHSQMNENCVTVQLLMQLTVHAVFFNSQDKSQLCFLVASPLTSQVNVSSVKSIEIDKLCLIDTDTNSPEA